MQNSNVRPGSPGHEACPKNFQAINPKRLSKAH